MAAKKQTYSFTLPDGHIETRNSVRPLTHVVIGLNRPESFHRRTYGTTWTVQGWHSSLESAQKDLRSYDRWNNENHPDNLSIETI